MDTREVKRAVKGVRWSRAQYEAYLKRTGTIPAPQERRKKPVAGHTAPKRGKTKTELEFELAFKREHPSMTLLYEAIKLRIDATCWYLPDYWCPELMTFYEVKGPYIYPDALIKFKAARAIHSWCRWEMWQCVKGNWRQIRALPGESLED